MDITTLLGLVIGITVVALAVMTGSDMWIFINIPGFLIVLGGTFAATLIKFPLSTVFVALRLGVKAAFVNEKSRPRELLDTILDCAKLMRKEGPMALSQINAGNEFLGKGIQFLVDGYDFDVMRKAMTSEMELTIQRHEQGEKIFRGIGESAPAFGMIGTLVGLVQMLSNMEDPKSIGPAMAIALLTTLYGALIANLVALPIADKLASKTEQERVSMSLILEGILEVHDRQNPNVIEELLEVYLPESERSKSVDEDEEEPPIEGK